MYVGIAQDKDMTVINMVMNIWGSVKFEKCFDRPELFS
jgi:hypothetical protein